MSHVFMVDGKKWKELQKRSEEFWSSEEGQKRKQEMRACAASFDDLIRTGKTTVRLISNGEVEVSDETEENEPAESSEAADTDNCIISFLPGGMDKETLLQCGHILVASYPAKSVQEGIQKFLEDPHYKISGANEDCTILCAKLYPPEVPVGCARLREQHDVNFLVASFKLKY